ncbi:MAG: RNA methyltransferase [Lachnospiraceae bacterium]|nr:RNA methyltransferase [Lachnospiraceae bacterium]
MITSVSNSRVKQVVQLNTKSKARRESGLFTAEGLKLFREVPKQWVDSVYVTESFAKEHREMLRGIDAELVDDKVFAKMCDTKTPQGILTVIKIPSYRREDLLGNGKTPFLMVLEDLQDPGNAGTILRTAEGAGVTGVILSKKTVDLFAPKTIRSTMGSIFRMPFVVEENLSEALDWLKLQGVETYAAHLKGQHSYSEEDYRKGCAFLVGNEGNGLTEQLSARADHLIRIPMEGQVESLNASIAAAILMYTVHAQRNGCSSPRER